MLGGKLWEAMREADAAPRARPLDWDGRRLFAKGSAEAPLQRLIRDDQALGQEFGDRLGASGEATPVQNDGVGFHVLSIVLAGGAQDDVTVGVGPLVTWSRGVNENVLGVYRFSVC